MTAPHGGDVLRLILLQVRIWVLTEEVPRSWNGEVVPKGKRVRLAQAVDDVID